MYHEELVPKHDQLKQTTGPVVLSIMILDASGSMAKYGSIPQDAVNGHVRALSDGEDGVSYWASVVTFSDRGRVAIPLSPVENIGPMTDYNPGGRTLLYATVNRVIGEIRRRLTSLPEHVCDRVRVVVGVFSDGEDNESSRLTYPKILRQTADRVRQEGWELHTYGIGIDSEKLASLMGFPLGSGHTMTVEASRGGVEDSVIDMTQITQVGDWRRREPK